MNCPLSAASAKTKAIRWGFAAAWRSSARSASLPSDTGALDGTRFLVTHQWELLRGDYAGCDIVVFAHTHKPFVQQDAQGCLLVNPGETSGWTYGRPTIAILETTPRRAEIVSLC